MSLFSIIKLATDYAKAKKFVEKKITDKKVDIEKIKNHMEKVKGFVGYLKGLKKEVEALILKGKDIYEKLSIKLEELKVTKEDK